MNKTLIGIIIGIAIFAGAGAIYQYREPIGNWFYNVFHYEHVEEPKEEEQPEMPSEDENADAEATATITLNTANIWAI